MMNNILKVYGEDLASGDLAIDVIEGKNPVKAGQTSGALCVNVFAQGDVVVTNEIGVSIKHSDVQTGGFSECVAIGIEAGKTFRDGDLIASATLPHDVKAYVVADVSSSDVNSGGIRVTLGYLAR